MDEVLMDEVLMLNFIFYIPIRNLPISLNIGTANIEISETT